MGIARVMPVSQVESTWEDLIRIGVGLSEQKSNQMAGIRLIEA